MSAQATHISIALDSSMAHKINMAADCNTDHNICMANINTDPGCSKTQIWLSVAEWTWTL